MTERDASITLTTNTHHCTNCSMSSCCCSNFHCYLVQKQYSFNCSILRIIVKTSYCHCNLHFISFICHFWDYFYCSLLCLGWINSFLFHIGSLNQDSILYFIVHADISALRVAPMCIR